MNYIKNTRRLSLTKYTFLNYLKGDFFAWLTDDYNYLKASEKYNELIKAAPHRYQKIINKNKENELLDLPSTLIDGLDVSNWSKKFYILKYKNFKVFDLSLEKFSKFEDIVEKTRLIMKNEDNFVLFEGAFSYNDFNIRTDVIIKNNGKYKLCEVKAVTCPLYYHAFDIMFQVKILEKNNYDVKDFIIRLTILNNDFKLLENETHADPYKILNARLLDLFLEYNVYFHSKPSNLKNAVEAGRGNLISSIFDDSKYFEILKDINFQNFDLLLEKIKINQMQKDIPKLSFFEERNFAFLDSEYMSFFYKYMEVPLKNSIFDFAGDSYFSTVKKANYFNDKKNLIFDIKNEELVSKGVLENLNPPIYNLLNNFNLETFNNFSIIKNFDQNGKKLKRIIQKYFTLHNKIWSSNSKLKLHLDEYQKVIYMYDFETVSQAIPRVKNAKVYEQIPYQYSIHIILDSSDFDFKTNRNIIHREWLATNDKDFYKSFWNNFVKDMQEFGSGSFVSYNKQFEKSIIKNYLDRIDSKDNHFLFLQKIYNETLDLMIPFSNFWYYSPDFKGSYSIKVVGPHFVPEINYKNLDKRVQKGDQSAKQAKIWLISNSELYDKKWEDVRDAMLKYCSYDTLLMVAIYQRLKELLNNKDNNSYYNESKFINNGSIFANEKVDI